MGRWLPRFFAVFLILGWTTASAQEASTPLPGASPSPDARIERFLLSEEQVPEGLVVIQDGERTLEDVAGGFSDPDATIDQFLEWGWRNNVVRAFHIPAGTEADPEEIDGIYMSVHEFGSAEDAAAALDYSVNAHIAGGEGNIDELPDIQMGDSSRVLYGELSYGDEITLYVQEDNVLIRLSAASPEGDPTREATDLMNTVLETTTATPEAMVARDIR
jgi:hypothetical protein